MDKKIIRAALLGFGTVGTGVYKVLQKQKEDMIPKLGSQIEIKKILVRNLEKAAAKVEDPAVLTNNWDEIVNDPAHLRFHNQTGPYSWKQLLL